MQADHVVVGTAFQARPDLRISLEAYRKPYRDYPVSVDYPALTLANSGIGFDMANILFPMTSQGRGRAEGLPSNVALIGESLGYFLGGALATFVAVHISEFHFCDNGGASRRSSPGFSPAVS